MSATPFPLEQAEEKTSFEPTWDLDSNPATPPWYRGMGFDEDTAYAGPAYRILEGMGSGAAKGEMVLGGMLHAGYEGLSSAADAISTPGPFSKAMGKSIESGIANIQQDARERVSALTPDPKTTGTAVQLLHGVTEGAYLMAAGALAGGVPGAAATVGLAEGASQYSDLRAQGVDRTTAAVSAGVRGILSAAGAVMPAAYGEALLTRMATGAVSNTAFGFVNRYMDHSLLLEGGYKDMAEQQKTLDSTQLLVDAALGATFGVVHHALNAHEQAAVTALRSPNNEDAALTANLALADRRAAPGIPIDPGSAALHQAAQDKAGADLAQGKSVDLADTGIENAQFLRRPVRDLTPEANLMLETFRESGLLDEEANLRDLDAALAVRRGEEPPEHIAIVTTRRKESADLPTYYHGTRSQFDIFDTTKSTTGDLVGAHFTETPEQARKWGEVWSKGGQDSRVVAAKLYLKNSASYADKKAAISELGPDWTRQGLTDALKAKGFDSYKDENEIVAFDKKSIIPHPEAVEHLMDHELAKQQFEARMSEHEGFEAQPQEAKDFTALTAEARRHGTEDEIEHALEAQDDVEAERRLQEIIDRGTRSEPKADVGGEMGRDQGAGQGEPALARQPSEDEARLPSQTQTAAALTERPRLAIPNEAGEPVSAQKELFQKSEDAALASHELPKAVKAAVNCFARMGG